MTSSRVRLYVNHPYPPYEYHAELLKGDSTNAVCQAMSSNAWRVLTFPSEAVLKRRIPISWEIIVDTRIKFHTDICLRF